MKPKRYTTEQIIRILRQGDSGQTIESICREHNISEVVSPAHKKRAVSHITSQGLCSVRRACRVLKLNRSTYQYRLKLPTFKQQRLKARIIALSRKHSRYGYRRIRALLDQEGWQVSRKLVQKVRRGDIVKCCG